MTEIPTAPAPPGSNCDFNQSWLFGGVYADRSEQPDYDESGFTAVTLPHTVVPLSWGNWDQASWERTWIYRKHFTCPEARGSRVFVDFDGVMVRADAVLNGIRVSTHQGGYLPWSAELTGQLVRGDNVLAVIVDSRRLPVPPDGGPGTIDIDFMQPGGIYREVRLRVVPTVFIADVFARPVNVLSAGREVLITATIDAATPAGSLRLDAELRDGARTLATARTPVKITESGTTVVSLAITGIGRAELWSPDNPKLYTIRTTLANAQGAVHAVEVRTGFREAIFRLDGFYLNGQRLQLFGLNRHQLFPYIGMAAPARLQRKDAAIIKRELNCNMVRCSHYPQSPHFLDACDELGLMVWEEPPGWQHVGDAAWQDIVLQNVHDMIIRDRNRPSVIVWATRLNETPDHERLYARTRELANQLDGTRQTTGATNAHSAAGWGQDVYAYNDYHARRGNARMLPALPGLPYLVSEAVGALSGPPAYRWTDTGKTLAAQARLHAQVHNIAHSDSRIAGVLAWAAIDYPSVNGGKRIWKKMKTPGVLDAFRVPKPGAVIYRSQVDPQVRPIILPAFCWQFGRRSPAGPGTSAMIATNCDRLEIYVGGKHIGTGIPDTNGYGFLAYPPVFVDLTVDGSGLPELLIIGYIGLASVAVHRMSADTSRDQLAISADSNTIRADGTDATQVTFRALDAYGNQRLNVGGYVELSLTGPAALIGDNPFPFADYGAVGGAFIRSEPGRTGLVEVTARHAELGHSSVRVSVTSRRGHVRSAGF